MIIIIIIIIIICAARRVAAREHGTPSHAQFVIFISSSSIIIIISTLLLLLLSLLSSLFGLTLAPWYIVRSLLLAHLLIFSKATDVTPKLPTKIIPAKICWLIISRKCPMELRIPSLNVKIMLESSPLKSSILVRRSAAERRCVQKATRACKSLGIFTNNESGCLFEICEMSPFETCHLLKSVGCLQPIAHGRMACEGMQGLCTVTSKPRIWISEGLTQADS